MANVGCFQSFNIDFQVFCKDKIMNINMLSLRRINFDHWQKFPFDKSDIMVILRHYLCLNLLF